MTIYAVNGKEPIAAWIPSLDTAGNGTTTLTGLVGGNNGTLVNSPTWVADTGAGGIRALNFSAAGRDYVNFGNICYLPNDCSICFWVYKMGTSIAFSNFWAVTRWNSGGSPGTNEFSCCLADASGGAGTGNNPSFLVEVGSTSYIVTSSIALTLNAWAHVVCVRNGANLQIYLNGALTGTTGSVPTTAITNRSRNLRLADSDFPTDLGNNERFDDLRIFNTAINASDVSYLYNSGNGRGRIANNRNNMQMGVAF